MAKISVALPVHNAAATIRSTLESLEKQTYRDFTVFVFDDASSDDTLGIVNAFRDRLDLNVSASAVNLGISGARNQLLAMIDSPLVAILDHDDICHPERFTRQLKFLEQHPEIDICGSAVTFFTEDREIATASRILRHPSDDAVIRTTLLRNTPLVHPSAMARRSFFEDAGPYEAVHSPAEDYALWCRAAIGGKRFANLPESLLYYRLHAKQSSNVQAEKMMQQDIDIKRRYICDLLKGIPDESLAELLCPYVRHDRAAVAAALPTIFPVILALSGKVPCRATYSQLISKILGDYLRQ